LAFEKNVDKSKQDPGMHKNTTITSKWKTKANFFEFLEYF
jgi:hypothetical protein